MSKEELKFYKLLQEIPVYNGKNKFFNLKKEKERYYSLRLSLPIENCTIYFKKLKDEGYIESYMPSSILTDSFEGSNIIYRLK